MALDIEKLRAKLEALKDPKKNSSNKADRKTWSPDPAKPSTIRLFQYPYSEDPFVEMHFHYGIGKGPGIVCLRQTHGKTCPICEFGYELYKSGDKESSKKFFAKPRFYAAMIDRSEANPVPRLWGFGKEIYQQLIEALLSEDWGSFLDPVSGNDAEVKSEKAEGAEWAKSKLTLKKKETRLAATDKEVQAILSAVPTIETVFPLLTPKEMEARIANWLQLTEKDGNETVKGNATPDAVQDDVGGSDANLQGLDDAFAQALKSSK